MTPATWVPVLHAGDRWYEAWHVGDFHRPSLHWQDGKRRLGFDEWLPAKGICMGYAENRGASGRPAVCHAALGAQGSGKMPVGRAAETA